MLKTFLTLTVLVLSACSLQPKAAVHGDKGPTIDPKPPGSTARDRCSNYRGKLEAALGRKSAADDVESSAEDLQRLLDDIAASPELAELLACLSGK